MSSEYRFSLTPRLIALGVFASVALMVLLFALGYLVGQRMSPAGEQGEGQLARAAGRAEQRIVNQAEKGAAGAAAPLTAPVKSAGKALQ